ncbi:hypothetical protein [Enhygromyxa salina]|uniref:hypothetical protein n=1 Tax=Enhygromyxa salina TaxID=215803 RepID=UPI0015E711FB|nr:hypothetical protein [Enhygromyxa salina]
MSAAHTASHPRRSKPGARVSLLVLLGALVMPSLGCPVSGNGGASNGPRSSYPPASVYEIDPQFAGEWDGDVDGLPGTLNIGELDDRSFFGSFVTHDNATEYTLLLEHSYVDTEDGGEVPSNRVTFTWQDGLGSRGKGWLLINREDTALTGSFGYGVATEGLGEWSFVRENF